MFKKRSVFFFKYRENLRFGNNGFYAVKLFFFELVYFRFFKKLLKRKSLKGKFNVRRSKIYFFLKPNFVVSKKSRNARMGAGVGKFLRILTKIYPRHIFIETKYVPCAKLKNIKIVLKKKMPNAFSVVKFYN